MGAFEDVCRHEAGHAVIASLQGLLTLRILVRPATNKTDWIGYRHGTGGPPSARLKVAAAGIAGELIAKAANWQAVSPHDMHIARNRSADDRQKYVAISRGEGDSFDMTAAGYCWDALAQNRLLHTTITEELASRQHIGPLVLAEVLSGLAISDGARRADDEYLVRLEVSKPAPPVP